MSHKQPAPLVVLGARVRDGRPCRLLEARLIEALRLWREDTARTLVVSGEGESDVMAAWLQARGVPPANIVEEPRARSTNENLENCRALLPDAPLITVVTNRFHVPRTRVWAWHLGIPAEVVAAPTPRRARLKNYAREVIALPHSVARVVWRRLVSR